MTLSTPHSIMVIIDVFRAFTTAAYALDQDPENYFLTNKTPVVERLIKEYPEPFLIGKPEIGQTLAYHIPNSPTRVQDHDLKGKTIIHRTEAGAKGVLESSSADQILVVSFPNILATAQYLKQFDPATITIKPMGHEGTTPSLEDNLCAEVLKSLLEGNDSPRDLLMKELKEGPGKYFFQQDQLQYPKDDFKKCLEIGKFNFVIEARIHGDYASLHQLK